MQHLTAGVSATALTVAAARAIATAEGRIDDPFARLFVGASGHDELPLTLEAASDESRSFWTQISSYLAARTSAFDAALLDATGRGAGQVVLVAAGLDARAYRLEWPAGTRFFEIDRASVLEAKQLVLDASGHSPTTQRTTIATDLAHDWPSALTAEGFDASAPTAWLVEGVLPYLPAALETSLVESIDALSAPGSSIALEFIRRPDDSAELGAGSSISALFDPDPRPDTLGLLRYTGWRIRSEPVGDWVTWGFASR